MDSNEQHKTGGADTGNRLADLGGEQVGELEEISRRTCVHTCMDSDNNVGQARLGAGQWGQRGGGNGGYLQ